jgi:hypothetical protein
MAQSTPDPPALVAMTVAELEAAIAALPGKWGALREAFDRLAACSPSPLPFAWEDLDGYISSLQSSVALRFRQVRALEAAGAVPAAAASLVTRGDGKGENQELEEDDELDEDVAVEVEEKVAVEVEEEADEEIQEADSDKICNDEKDGKEAREVEVEKEVAELEKADEDMQEANSDKFCNDEKDGNETREVEVEDEVAELEKKADLEMQEVDYDKICNDEKDEKGGKEEVVEEEGVEEASNIKIGNEIKYEKESREEEQASKVNEQDPDKEMQVVDKDKLNTKGAFKASQDKEKDQDTNMDETVTKMASSVQHKEGEEEACDRKQKEAQKQDLHEKVEGTKNAKDQGNRALPRRSDDCTVACAYMDAKRLVKLVCTNTDLKSELHAAFRCAPDAAAVALHVVELFLHNKTFVRTNKVWANCVELVQMVPVFVTKPSADTTEQAKRMAKDWKEMIDSPESCYVLGSLASWGLLYFLISYNIVTEFDMKEIFRLFGNIPFKQKKKSAMLLKGLGLSNRIPGTTTSFGIINYNMFCTLLNPCWENIICWIFNISNYLNSESSYGLSILFFTLTALYYTASVTNFGRDSLKLSDFSRFRWYPRLKFRSEKSCIPVLNSKKKCKSQTLVKKRNFGPYKRNCKPCTQLTDDYGKSTNPVIYGI